MTAAPDTPVRAATTGVDTILGKRVEGLRQSSVASPTVVAPAWSLTAQQRWESTNVVDGDTGLICLLTGLR